jgi:hypothetical protein
MLEELRGHIFVGYFETTDLENRVEGGEGGWDHIFGVF